MKHGPHAVESDSYPRTSSLADFRSKHRQHRLDVEPCDARANGIVEDRFQRFLVFPAHRCIVS